MTFKDLPQNHWVNYIISLLFPYRKERDPSLEQTWIPLFKGGFVPSLVYWLFYVLRRIGNILHVAK